jgi:hypothetical protein
MEVGFFYFFCSLLFYRSVHRWLKTKRWQRLGRRLMRCYQQQRRIVEHELNSIVLQKTLSISTLNDNKTMLFKTIDDLLRDAKARKASSN